MDLKLCPLTKSDLISRKHPTIPKVHYPEGSLVRRVLGLGLGLGVKEYLCYIIFYYTLKTDTRQVRTGEPSD